MKYEYILRVTNDKSLKDIEREAVIAVLRTFNWNRMAAARHLIISVRTIRNLIRQYKKEGYYISDSPYCNWKLSLDGSKMEGRNHPDHYHRQPESSTTQKPQEKE